MPCLIGHRWLHHPVREDFSFGNGAASIRALAPRCPIGYRASEVTLSKDIHNHRLWMMPNVYPGLVARKHNVPLVISPRGTLSEWAFQHGSVVKRLFWPLVQKPALTATSCFHATAESEYKDIRRMGFRQPVAIIPNGIDIPAFARKHLSISYPSLPWPCASLQRASTCCCRLGRLCRTASPTGV